MKDYEKANRWYGYDKATDTRECKNCGLHGMYVPPPDGKVELRKDNGQPCVHEFRGQNIGRCMTEYTCVHCESSHIIDSGD